MSFFKRGAGVLSVAAALVLLALVLTQVRADELAALVARADVPLVLLGIVFSVAALGARTLRWFILLAEVKRLPFAWLFAVQAAGTAVSNFSPARVLEAAKVVPLKAKGVRYSFALLSVLWERLLDLMVLFLFGLLSLASLGGATQEAFLWLFFFLLLAVFALRELAPPALAVASRLSPLAFLKKVEVHPFQYASLLASFLATLGAWVLDFAAVFLAFTALGLHVDFFTLAATFSLSVVIGLISLLPGGLGATEASWLLLLLPTGIPAPSLIGGIFLARVLTLGTSSLVGAAFLATRGTKIRLPGGSRK